VVTAKWSGNTHFLGVVLFIYSNHLPMYTTTNQTTKMNSRKAIIYTLIIHASFSGGIALCFTPDTPSPPTPYSTDNTLVKTTQSDKSTYFQEKIMKVKE